MGMIIQDSRAEGSTVILDEEGVTALASDKSEVIACSKSEQLIIENPENTEVVSLGSGQYLKGDTGDKGDKGDRGDVGYQGLKGDKGDKGDQGDQGLKGDTGDRGFRGYTGVGEKGDKGDTGNTGGRGEKGEKGDKGDQGERGPAGEGLQGIKGDTGVTSFVWAKYADTTTPLPEDMYESPDDRIYVGLAYNRTVEEGQGDPLEFDYTQYKWSKIQGLDGNPGTPGNPGGPGAPGTGFNWIGEWPQHPTEADIGRPIEDGDTYLNTTDQRVYTYAGGWHTMLNSGGEGPIGPQGAPGGGFQYQGEFDSSPSGALVNWLYLNTNNSLFYVYDGTAWTVATSDGKASTDGAECGNGLRFFTTYHASESIPAKPTLDGDTNGWNPNPHSFTPGDIKWVSQKLATDPQLGTWNGPIDITLHGFRGPVGFRGSHSIMVPIPGWNGIWDDNTAASVCVGGAPQEWDVVTMYKSEDPEVQITKRWSLNSQNGVWEWLDYNYVFLGDVLVDGTVDGTAFNARTTITAGETANKRAYMSGDGAFRFWAGSDDPTNAPFWVDEEGNGKFSGTLVLGGEEINDIDEITGRELRSIFKNSLTSPTTPPAGYPPSGWTTNPTSPVTGEYSWICTAYFTGAGDQDEAWSNPAIWAGNPDDGVDGDTILTEFWFSETGTGNPTTHPSLWGRTQQADDAYMISREVVNGVGGAWSEATKFTGAVGDTIYIEYQYSINGTSNWHDDYASTDYFRRERTVTVTPTGVNYGSWTSGKRIRTDGDDGYTPIKGVDYFDGVDGSFTSYVYRLSDSALTPVGGSFDGSTEVIPNGWSDNPVYSASVKTQVSTCRYIKSGSSWIRSPDWSASVQWLGSNGTDGIDGTSGLYHSYIYTNTVSTAAPNTPTGGSFNGTNETYPSGWTDDPEYQTGRITWISHVKYKDNYDGTWSRVSGWSAPSEFSTAGKYFDTRYQAAETRPTTPTGPEPLGWLISPPDATKPQVVWATTATKHSTGELDSSWSTPVQWSSLDGDTYEEQYRYNTTGTATGATLWNADARDTDRYRQRRMLLNGVVDFEGSWHRFSLDGESGDTIYEEYRYNSSASVTGATGWGVDMRDTDYFRQRRTSVNGAITSIGDWHQFRLDGNYFETRYRRYPTKPATPTVAQPANWLLEPAEEPSGQTLWATVAKKSDIATLVSTWSDPVKWAGNDGENGRELRAVYRTSSANPGRPSGTGYPPSGWSITPTNPTEIARVWISVAWFQNGVMSDSQWGYPTIWSGIDGSAYDDDWIYPDQDNLSIKSGNYISGSTGWAIDNDGDAEFNNAVVRGTVYATAGTFAGELQAATGSFSGELSAASGSFTGLLSGATGSFTGTVRANGGVYGGTTILDSGEENISALLTAAHLWKGTNSLAFSQYNVIYPDDGNDGQYIHLLFDTGYVAGDFYYNTRQFVASVSRGGTWTYSTSNAAAATAGIKVEIIPMQAVLGDNTYNEANIFLGLKIYSRYMDYRSDSTFKWKLSELLLNE